MSVKLVVLMQDQTHRFKVIDVYDVDTKQEEFGGTDFRQKEIQQYPVDLLIEGTKVSKVHKNKQEHLLTNLYFFDIYVEHIKTKKLIFFSQNILIFTNTLFIKRKRTLINYKY